MITQEEWMDLLSYRSLAASGATWAEIARLALGHAAGLRQLGLDDQPGQFSVRLCPT